MKNTKTTSAKNKSKSTVAKNAGTNAPRQPKPRMPWQTGDYQRHANFRFILPYQFLLLCRIMNITPDQLLTDFMDDLSCGSWKRQGRERAKEKLIEYFIEHGYGRQHYTEEDIRAMFRELDAIGLLWPHHADEELTELHAKWRDKYHAYWFQKWFRKGKEQ